MPNNQEFLNALFGECAPWVHVTDFSYDPGDIPQGRHLAAWRGDYFSRYQFGSLTNQYFTVSTFYADEHGQARRRKALFRQTHVIMLDDVKEKLAMEEVSRLPRPTWILETSPGSEQWGYLLSEPCKDRARVENLQDGLIANGLAPGGRDPGQKGVTRYVRLPDGYNTKAEKMINGQPFKCRMLLWEPFNTVTLEQLAEPFNVNLDAVRREARVDGAADVTGHPLIDVNLLNIKEVRSAGRFDITCPWVDEHTGAADDGAAVFTNADNTIGFKCHHGACESRTGRDLLQYMEAELPGFNARLKQWQLAQQFVSLADVNFLSGATPSAQTVTEAPTIPTPPVAPVTELASTDQILSQALNTLRSHPPFTAEAREIASQLLKSVDELPEIDRLNWHNQVRDVMRWSKPEFKTILKDLRRSWYEVKEADISFFDDVVFIAELNQFFDRRKRIFYSVEAYQNTYAHLDPEARKVALQGGRVTKVDKLDYAPKRPAVFEESGILYANSWHDLNEPAGTQGDVSRWLDHWGTIGWTEHRKHMLQFMAFTVLHPDQKINHMLLLGSGEGCGKDFLLYPLVKAMGENHMTIAGEELLTDFQDYILSTKHLHVNEAELGDRREAMAVANKLKPLAAAPPDKLRVNQKGIKPIQVRNLLSVTMTTNSQLPVRLNGPSRRIFAIWSDMNPRDEYDNMRPEWIQYWKDRWEWMENGGADACIWYLRNCVDLSDFNPGAAPPVTDFLRDIREASKSPMQITIESFIQERIGIFKSDLVTIHDAVTTLRSGPMIAPSMMYCDEKLFTPQRVANVLREIPGTAKHTGRAADSRVTVWAVRNSESYRFMTAQEVYAAWKRQQTEVKGSVHLSVMQ